MTNETKLNVGLIICFILLILTLVVNSEAFTDEFEYFGVDINGEYCQGGLFLNTNEGLNTHVTNLLRSGSFLASEQEKTKYARIRDRMLEFRKKINGK